jgi:hypothetical protein
MVVAQILSTTGTELSGLFTASPLMLLKLERASESSNVAHFQFLARFQQSIGRDIRSWA